MTYYQPITTAMEKYEGLRGFLKGNTNDDGELVLDFFEKTVLNCEKSGRGNFIRNPSVVNQVKTHCKRHKLRHRLRKKLEEKKKKEAEELEARKKEEVYVCVDIYISGD